VRRVRQKIHEVFPCESFERFFDWEDSGGERLGNVGATLFRGEQDFPGIAAKNPDTEFGVRFNCLTGSGRRFVRVD